MTIVGLHDFVKVSISASLKSFLLIICIDAPESITNSRSLGFRVDAGRQAPISRRRVECRSLYAPFIFNTFLGQLPGCFAGTLLLSLCLFLRPILKFWSVGTALMRLTWANISERRTLVSNFSVMCNSFGEFHTLD